MPILSLGRRWQGVSARWLTKPARHTRLPKAGLEFTPAAAKEMMTYGVWEEGQGGLSREARPGWRRGPAPASEAAAGTDAVLAAGGASPGGRRGHRWSGQCERQQQRSRGLECDGTDRDLGEGREQGSWRRPQVRGAGTRGGRGAGRDGEGTGSPQCRGGRTGVTGPRETLHTRSSTLRPARARRLPGTFTPTPHGRFSAGHDERKAAAPQNPAHSQRSRDPMGVTEETSLFTRKII